MTITVKLFTQKATIVKISIENTVDCLESGSHFLLSLKYFLQCCKFYLLDIPQYKPDRRTCKKILRAWSCISDSPKSTTEDCRNFECLVIAGQNPQRAAKCCCFSVLIIYKYSIYFLWLLNYYPFVSIMWNQTKLKPLITPLSPQNSDKKT